MDEAAAIRDKTGTLGDAAWSKLAPCAQTTSRALGYALTKLQSISDKLSRAESVDKIEHALYAAKDDVPAWLVMISRAVQTRDKLSVIELERAYAELPEVLEEHRVGIIATLCEGDRKRSPSFFLVSFYPRRRCDFTWYP